MSENACHRWYLWRLENGLAVLAEDFCTPVKYDEPSLRIALRNTKSDWRSFATPEAHARQVWKFKTGLNLFKPKPLDTPKT